MALRVVESNFLRRPAGCLPTDQHDSWQSQIAGRTNNQSALWQVSAQPAATKRADIDIDPAFPVAGSCRMMLRNNPIPEFA
jgi:hypothetical protein